MNTNDLAALNTRLASLHQTAIASRALAEAISRGTAVIEGITIAFTPAQKRLLRDAISVRLANVNKAADSLLSLTGKTADPDETVVAKATASPALLPGLIHEPLQQLRALADNLPATFDATGADAGPVDDTIAQQIAQSMATVGAAIKPVAAYIAALAGVPAP